RENNRPWLMENKPPGWDRCNAVIMILEGGSGRYANNAGAHTPNVKPFRGAYRPVWFPPGMLEGITPLILFVILKDSKAKADIFSKGNTTPDARLLMDAGLLARQPDKEVRGDVRGDTDPDTGFRGVEINVSDRNLTAHAIQEGSGKGR
ncbi:unnamed protein product, partial [marine sediment metagenome]